MKKFLLPLFLLCYTEIKADECEKKCDEKDTIKFALTIEKPDNVDQAEWVNLEKVVCECIKECEEAEAAEQNLPTFLQDAKEHIGKILVAIEKLPSFNGLFHLSVNPQHQES